MCFTRRSWPRPARSRWGRSSPTRPPDWTVTASLYATLNEMYGNRTICGIGRGDSAVRVTGGRPTTLKALRESIHVIRELANSRAVEYNGATLQFLVERQPVGCLGGRLRSAGVATGR